MGSPFILLLFRTIQSTQVQARVLKIEKLKSLTLRV